jgi:hypothetical protein
VGRRFFNVISRVDKTTPGVEQAGTPGILISWKKHEKKGDLFRQ